MFESKIEVEKKRLLDCLMADWKNVIKTKDKILFPDDGKFYDAQDYFYSDGFYPGYFSAEKKVLFIGREARYASGGDRVENDLEWFKNHSATSYNYWRRILYLAYGIKKNGTAEFENMPYANEIWNQMVKGKCFNFSIMNISKYSNDSEGGAVANSKLINRFLVDSELDKRNFIREEISLLEPDIIITANLWDGKIDENQLEKIFPTKDFKLKKIIENSAFLYDFNFTGKKIQFIDVPHFSSIGSDKEKFFDPVMELLFG